MEMEMGLKEIGGRLPPGFRFYPTDEELVCHYLQSKLLLLSDHHHHHLIEIDLHTCEPWQLPDAAMLNANEWYFFSFRDRKYTTGFRANRATKCGYWKATGKDRAILDPNTGQVVGMRKTLVFYMNRAPNGMKTGWIMHEFRLESPHMPPKEDWVLCRVFHKSKGKEITNQDPLSLQSTEPESHQSTMTTYGSQGLLSFESNLSSQARDICTQDPSSLVQDSSLFDPNYNMLPLLEDDGPSTSFNNAGTKAVIDAPKTIDTRDHDRDDVYGFFRDLGCDGSNDLERGALASYHHQFGGWPGI